MHPRYLLSLISRSRGTLNVTGDTDLSVTVNSNFALLKLDVGVPPVASPEPRRLLARIGALEECAEGVNAGPALIVLV